MRKVFAVMAGAALAVVLSGGPAAAAPPPPHCDPAACPDPVEIVDRVVCYVGAQLGLQCV